MIPQNENNGIQRLERVISQVYNKGKLSLIRSFILIIIGKNIKLIFKLLNIPLQKPIGLYLLIRLFLNHDLRVCCYSLTARIQKLGAKGKSALDKQIVWPGPPICPMFVTYKDFCLQAALLVSTVCAQWKLPKLSLPRFVLLIQLVTTALSSSSLFLPLPLFLLPVFL